MISFECYKKFDKLNKKIKLKVLRNVLYYVCFLKGYTFSKKLDDYYEHDEVNVAIGLIKQNKLEAKIYFKKKTSDTLIKKIDNDVEELSIELFLNQLNFINDNVLWFFIFTSDNSLYDYNLISSWNYDFNNEYKENIKKKKFHFLLGNGVSVDYSSKKWETVITNMKKEIELINPSLNVEKIEGFFGNLYGVPQILKNLKLSTYHDNLYNSVYSKLPFLTKKDSNLQKIAQYIERQYNKNQNNIEVATFNFDEYLENELALKKIDVGSEYIKCPIVNNTVKIKHIHGFLPIEAKLKCGSYISKYIDNLVFTEEEYNDAYVNNTKYTYKTLLKYLENTCLIVGNSLSDYEERKMFRISKNKENPVHFALMKKGDKFDDAYISMFLLSIGIITIFFDDYPDIGDYIDTL